MISLQVFFARKKSDDEEGRPISKGSRTQTPPQIEACITTYHFVKFFHLRKDGEFLSCFKYVPVLLRMRNLCKRVYLVFLVNKGSEHSGTSS